VKGLLGWDDVGSYTALSDQPEETLSVTRVSQTIDRIDAIFDDPNLVANAGLLLVATLSQRLGLEALIDSTVRLDGLVGGASPGRKVLTLAHSMCAGGSHIDHADMLRAGATASVLGHRVMAPSTIGTFLRSFTFGHCRRLVGFIEWLNAQAGDDAEREPRRNHGVAGARRWASRWRRCGVLETG